MADYDPRGMRDHPARPVEDRDAPSAPLPNNEAIDAAMSTLRAHGLQLVFGGEPAAHWREAVGEALVHAQQYIDPIRMWQGTLSKVADRAYADGLEAARTRADGPLPDPSTPAEVVKRLDGLIDVVLRQESRLIDAIREVGGKSDQDLRVDAAYQRGLDIGRLQFQDDPPAVAEVFPLSWGVEERERHRRHLEVMARIAAEPEPVELDSVEFGEPSPYEVWRDALQLANAESKGEWMQADILERAKWWRRQLMRTDIGQPDQPPTCDPGDCDPSYDPHEPGCIYHPDATARADPPHGRPPTSESGVSPSPDGSR